MPDGIQADLLGTNAKAIICALNGFYHNSKRDVQAIMKQIFNLKLSLGLVAHTDKRVNSKLASDYETLKEEIKQSEYLHIDETGHKSHGKRGWAWVFTNQTTTLIHLNPSRGQQVLASILDKYGGCLISERKEE